MFSAASVCLFACRHDNFRKIKRRMMKLGGYVHSTKISPEFECQGQRSKSPAPKKRKSATFCLGVVLWGAVLVRHFFGSVPQGAATQVGKSAHAVQLLYVFAQCETLSLLAAMLRGSRPGVQSASLIMTSLMTSWKL